MKSWTI